MAAMARIRAMLNELKRAASVVVDPVAILKDWYMKIRHKPRPPPSGSDSSSRLKLIISTSDDDHDLDDRRKKLIISMAVIAFAFGLYVCMISDDRHKKNRRRPGVQARHRIALERELGLKILVLPPVMLQNPNILLQLRGPIGF